MIASGDRMTIMTIRGLAIAVAVASLTLSGCGKREKPAAVAVAEEKPVATAADGRFEL